MDPLLLKALEWTALCTGFTFLCTTVGAAVAFFFRPEKDTALAETLSLGFAAGIMIAASVWSLIIPGLEMAEKNGSIPWLTASVGVIVGAVFLKFLDMAMPHLHPGSTTPEGPKSKLHRAQLLFLAITLHNIPEGGSVGLTSGLAAMSGDPLALSSAFALDLGIGIQKPMASWGSLANDAIGTLTSAPYQMFFPIAAISLTMFSLNFIGDGLRDALDPKLKK